MNLFDIIALNYFFDIATWGCSHTALECVAEIGLGRKAALVCDLRKRHICGYEQAYRFFYSLIFYVLVQRFSCGRLEKLVKIYCIKIRFAC